MQTLRWGQTPRWVRELAILLAIVLAGGLLLAGRALAVPKLKSAEECQFAAGMGATAAALAKNGVPQAKAEPIMLDIYVVSEQRGLPILRAIIVVAYRDKPEPFVFVQVIADQCMRGQGDLDAVLGTDS